MIAKKKKYRFYVFGYRNEDFWVQFGPVVRDLMIVESILKNEYVDLICFFNRPKSIYELLMGRRNFFSKLNVNSKLKMVNTISFDFLGPLKRRLWNKKVYSKYYNDIVLDDDYINVILDFLPIGDLPSWTKKSDLIWYDFIDNFTKHNRYSVAEKKEVQLKYDYINNHSEFFVSGVSKEINKVCSNLVVVPNAILEPREYYQPFIKDNEYKFDFGFLGFITDKFDIDVIKRISDKGYTVAIYGEFYDKDIKGQLESIKGVRTFGRFNNGEVKNILSSFRVGLIPYKIKMLHDESPLKLYQYLCSSKCVLSSFDFNFSHERFFVYNNENFDYIFRELLKAVEHLDYPISEEEVNSFSWKGRVDSLFKQIDERINMASKK